MLATCFHEAGHAVAALYFGLPFSRVSVVPDEDSLGHVAFDVPIDSWAGLICVISGPLSESYHLGKPFELKESSYPQSDYCRVLRLINQGFDYGKATHYADRIVHAQWMQIVKAAQWLQRLQTLTYSDFKLATQN